MNTYATLFSPFSLGGVPLRNRIVMLPMTTGICEADGTVGPRLVDFFAARARGGAGLIIAPFTPVHTGSAVDAGLFDDRFTQPATRLATAVHEAGAKISAQLIVTYKAAFPDGSEHGAAEVVGPSPVLNALLRVVPRELTVEEIHYLTAAYGRAAARAKAAGFDMVEVMAGGGYLVNRFLSPLTNRREDEYGGSLEKRLRFLLDIVWSIRREAGDGFPVMVRLNLDEQMAGGYSPADALEMARLLERRGVAVSTS